jgi:HD-like signal output (HDOD) protein
MDEIARVIQSDPGLAAQLLRVANSALYGRGRPIGSIEESIRVLGAKAVRQLVLTSAILNKFSGTTLAAAEQLWRHSVRSAAWAHELGRARGVHDDPFLHGLLHEIGHLVLLQAFPQDYAHIQELAGADASIEQAERQIFGTTHADVGFYVCRLWSLPEAFGQATLHHETPTAILRETPALLETTRVVHAACRLADQDLAAPADALDASFLAYHALTAEKLAELAARVDERTTEMMRSFAA